MNMALSGIHRFIFTVICINAGFAKAFVKLQCKTENSGQHGQESLLDCVIKMSQEMEDSEIRVVTWRREGEEKPLLSFYRGKTEKRRGYSFAEQSWNPKNMNVSLLITNTAVKDNGGYECDVVTNRGEAEEVTSLKVRAKYSTPTINIPEGISLSKESTLECKSGGGYPKGKISWYGEQGEDWTKSAELEVKVTEDGLFQLTSRLSLLQGSIFPKYTCVVFNATGGKEEEATVEIPSRTAGFGDDNKSLPVSKVIAPIVVIGSLIVGLLLALLIYRRRSRQARRPSTAPLMAYHEEVRSHDQDVHLERGEKKQHDMA